MSHGTLRKHRTGKCGKERRATNKNKPKKNYDRSKIKRKHQREIERYWA